MSRRYSRRAMLRGGAAGADLVWLGTAACGSGGNATKNAPSTSNATATATKQPVSVKGTYVGSGNDISTFIAKDAGIFKKHGLDLDLQVIAGPTAIAAIIAGEIQFAAVGTGETLNAVAQGAPVVVIATQSPVFPTKLYTRADIANPSQLKGKKVGITQPGGTFDVGLRLALPKFGLQPDKDVTFIATGSIANVTAALLNGAIDGALIGVGPDSAKMEAQGLHPLFDMTDIGLPFASQIIVAQRPYVSAHKDVVQNYIDAQVEAILRFKHDKPVTFEELSKLYKTTDQTGFADFYQFYTQDRVTPAYPYPRPEQFKNSQDVVCQKIPAVCSVDLTKVIDASFVQDAERRGIGKQ